MMPLWFLPQWIGTGLVSWRQLRNAAIVDGVFSGVFLVFMFITENPWPSLVLFAVFYATFHWTLRIARGIEDDDIEVDDTEHPQVAMSRRRQQLDWP